MYMYLYHFMQALIWIHGLLQQNDKASANV